MQQISAHMVQEVVPEHYTQCTVVQKLIRELVITVALKPLMSYAQPAVLAELVLMHVPGAPCAMPTRNEVQASAAARYRAAKSVEREVAAERGAQLCAPALPVPWSGFGIDLGGLFLLCVWCLWYFNAKLPNGEALNCALLPRLCLALDLGW